ncbi:transcription-repair coupling factor [Simiduia agarivorans]|uniref:Transcription-repair-coupling factor n=1 Tax=Simiduia agarivorans (strain DSM 21679 / JCM 13881 / BCRC 17597 / SA1) TaxID=1117647 RepID=K4KU13_SIMAS|nr:transcription-repair coupling factor [Simiduia agarivorans]AFU97472.1 transcription-repair coupling factor [Simiduia agarivorans SA1 = DSM 21679]
MDLTEPLGQLSPPLSNKPKFNQRWGKLPGAAVALAVSQATRAFDGLLLVITPDTASSLALQDELRFFCGDSTPILTLPDWETLPYDTFSPHQDIISERIKALYRLPTTRKGILVAPLTTLMCRLPPQQFVAGHSLVLNKGQTFDLNAQARVLEANGYHRVDTVYEHGEFAVRGALLDIYPAGSDWPLRIDLFDDEIESLRSFDPDTQRTLEQIDSIELLPAREFPLTKAAISDFRLRWHDAFDVDHKACPVYQDICDGIAPAGIEYYLPLFFDQCATLFDYLPENSRVLTYDNLIPKADRFWTEASNRYESRRVDPERPLLPPAKVFVPVNELFEHINSLPRTELNDDAPVIPALTPPQAPVDAKADQPLQALLDLLRSDRKTLFTVDSAGRREILLEMLAKAGIKPTAVNGWSDFIAAENSPCIAIAGLDQGLALSTPAVQIITENQLFGERVQQRRRRRVTQENELAVKNLSELNPGAPVVHIDHGVGRYQGLITLDLDGQPQEFLQLSYANDAKLYVPVANLHLISRYSGADDNLAPLHKLGSDSWDKAKRKAAEKVRDTAAELLDIYARRAARKGFAFADPGAAYQAFAASFPFEETPDQEQAIANVRKDMLASTPMDRLVCGDVGFGKTEVAMRAAFIAVQSGKQVAMLVPTTLLAQQHYESFKDRFADWPVNIEVVSRFKTGKEIDAIADKLKDGKVDIIVGTHKLLQPDFNYQSLGLLIIDEEHRFGVRQKEALKSIRSEVDILTLTATPIPRTLNMSMAGIRDLSIIATPPNKRLSIKTFVRVHDDALIKEAILRELLRGGQVYYLHNEVKSIEKTARELQALVPEARIGIGHGQMRERDLEKVMADFYHKRFNLLVATTIIETGIDVPSANTIIIERADKFGLAQLHQLRGRVGRSHHQAYAYLMTPNPKTLTSDATKRLEAIAQADTLGAGFTLATHDMEIRGAGELLGDEQSGQIEAVGFSMYMDMLNRAVKAIQAGKTPDLDAPLGSAVEINLRIPALIPDDYLPDVHSRLIMYKRIANAADEGALKELQVEMIDRFGLLPDPVKNLFRITGLKLTAEAMGIEKLEAGPTGGKISFNKEPKVDPLKIIKLVQTQPQKYQMHGANGLKFLHDMESTEIRLATTEALLANLV